MNRKWLYGTIWTQINNPSLFAHETAAQNISFRSEASKQFADKIPPGKISFATFAKYTTDSFGDFRRSVQKTVEMAMKTQRKNQSFGTKFSTSRALGEQISKQ
jgi:hypothetical protein